MKVLVFGAGQLAQMMYLAAVPLGVEVYAVDVNAREVVNPITKQKLDMSIEYAVSDVSVVTAEFEHVPEDLLGLAEKSGKLTPNMAAILTGADRVREKRVLQSSDIANCPHHIIDNIEQLNNSIASLGDKLIFKASRDGYDGYGQWRYTAPEDLPKLQQAFSSLDLSQVPLVAEKMLNFDREISLIGARDAQGNTACYEIAENLHYEGQLHVSIAPATALNAKIKQDAQAIFDRLANALSYVGVLSVEMFQMGEQLIVNEIAPRVHNSGHWTQKGADTCQFEQHMRAVLGFPLGDTQTHGVTAMVNIIGCTSFSRELISIPGCHLHWYGKELRAKRKMGHINVVAPSYFALGEKLMLLLEYLPAEYFPLLEKEAIRLKSLDA
ncbi:5-(carboxyamino)imidazole ribonucleotide synthase [Glaciecola sp. XM2]|uniref:5-(carboxyamino)imidazole ribonucleotide synthase n=1 Tax=Glaciecola sp. XM2 TaxID=1914931 RepID=UPI001BDF27C4|nr:5-(carboxyamino)imidazole ribonucleotide synthase [Glaciecola sp. XM2]MBT1452222.1 5-(carboxyamino)imidazole ribonucleotide synthase [Glaciecola sp. XM2]